MRMRTAVLAGAAPAAIFVGYALLTGYLLTRIKPAPIAVLPPNVVNQGE